MLVDSPGIPPSSGGDQALTDASGWTVTTNAPAPFSAHGLGASFRGEPRWSYPSAWPGLHASHEAAVPDRPRRRMHHERFTLGGNVVGLGRMVRVHAGLKHLVAAHLSERNNSPELVRDALAPLWGDTPDDIIVADQRQGFGWLSLR